MKSPAPWIWHIVRLVLGIVVAGVIFRRLQAQPDAFATEKWAPHWPLWMAAGHLLLFAAYLLGVSRWRILMASYGSKLKWERCFILFFIGHFFNAFLLGSTGGDMIKAWYAARETQHRKTESMTLIVLDRTLGLVALLSLVLAILAIRFPLLLENPTLLRWGALFLAALIALALVAAVAWSRNWPEHTHWKKAEASGRVRAFIFSRLGRVHGALYHFKKHPRALTKAFFLSVGVHACALASCAMFAAGVGAGLSLVQILTLFPILGAVGALPLTPGGLGFREGASVFLFGAIGISSDTAFLLSFLPYLSATLWSLFGGVLYLADPIRKKSHLPDNMRV